MEAKRSVVFMFLAGVFLGVVLGVEVLEFADQRTCPQSVCVDEASVVPLSDRGYFPAVLKVLKEAKSSIHVVAYELKYYPQFPGSSQNLLVEELAAAHERGVEVLIYVDDGSTENSAVEYLRERGIEVRRDSENVTTHAKLVVADGRVVVLGSTNFSFYGLEKNNEVDVIVVSGRAAAYFEDYFKSLWEG